MGSSRSRSAEAFNLFVSTALAGDIAGQLGAPHYSYHFAAQRFGAMFKARGLAPRHLAMPEYYADRTALPGGGAGADVHVIFRSTEQIRLLKPAANICCFAWEFPVLKTRSLPGEHPFANQAAMLSLCDEVWTPSAFAAAVLRANGVARVRRIPAPVPLPPGGRVDRAAARAALAGLDAVTLNINFAWPDAHQDAQAGAMGCALGDFLGAHGRGRRLPTVFLAVLNPEDFRKNLDALLRGFHLARREDPRAILIVKALTSRDRFSLGAVAGGVMRNKLAPGTVLRDEGIAIITEYLSEGEMSALYSLADFHLCASVAEGQNLPLLEAMAHGTVAVTTRNTAMEDYVSPDNAHIIAAREVDNDEPHLAGTLAGVPFAVSRCGARDVADAVRAAMKSTARARAARAEAGRAAVARGFSEDVVYRWAAPRLRHLAQSNLARNTLARSRAG